MKNLSIDHSAGLFATKSAGVSLIANTNKTIFQHHNSVKVATRVVKENGESLRIILPEATSGLVESGSTLFLAITRVFPIPSSSSKKALQVRLSDSYQRFAS